VIDSGILPGNKLRKFFALLALLPAFCFSAAATLVPTQPVELAWNVNPDPTVAGYMLSYGTNSGNYDNELDAGTNTSIEVPDLAVGQTNYFVVAAYNAQGVLGAPSSPISYVVPGSLIVTQTGALEVALNVPGAQWSVDSGSWQTNGAILSGLSVGSHTVSFSAMSGWTAPASQTISINEDQTNSISATYVAVPQTGALQVTLNTAGAQWAVDNGAWQTSGTVVSGLSVGSHTVSFSAVGGWTTPLSQTISIVASQTTSIAAIYVAIPQTGALKVTLNATGAQWAVDSGTLQTSGAIVSGLSVGSHTVTFSAVSGWTAPASQTISIVASQTNSITATYVAISQTGAAEATLNVTGAQWAVDSGTLQKSGAIVSGLYVGSHLVTFSAVSGYVTPSSQTVSVAANQTNSVTANYVAAQTGSLRVTVNVSSGQWSVDGGTSQNSGSTVSSLSVGSHTVSFSAVSGYTTPSSQTITVAANRTTFDSATYVAIPSIGALEVTLNVTGAQWAVDGGTSQNSGAVVSGLSTGSHTIAFSTMSGWTTPASQTISIVANQTNAVTATYIAIPQTGAVQATLNPTVAQWSVDSGEMQTNGAVVSGLSVGSHTITFSPVTGWTTPAIQTISIVANQTNSITATYLAIPQTGSLEITLNVPGAQWSVDSGTIQNSGAIVSGLSVGSHTIIFSAMSGWTTPASQTISIVANQTNTVTATYIAIPQTGAVQVTLSPAVAQWSVDSGTIQNSGAIVSGLSVGSHTITFSAMSGWTTPASQTISIVANQTNTITATYVAIPQTGAVQVTLNPAVAQWSVDSGALQNSAAIVSGLSVGSHTIAFSPVGGWTRPASETISIVANQTNSITATYLAIPQTGSLEITLNVPGAQWSVDDGNWQDSDFVLSGLSVGSHTVSFSAMTGWTAPTNQVVSIAASQTNSISAAYVAIPQPGSLQVTLNPAVTQWNVDSGAWQNSGAIVSGLSAGLHAIAFTALGGWVAPTNQTVAILAGVTNSITATYTIIPPIVSVVGPEGTQLTKDDPSLLALRHKKNANQGRSVKPNERSTPLNSRPNLASSMFGIYNGLFYPPNGFTQETSGMLSSLVVRTNGSYSGKVLIHGNSLSLSGTFDDLGHSCQLLPRSYPLGGPVTVDMTVAWNGAVLEIVGTVSGNNGAPWTANLIADPAAASAQSYQYTLLFPPSANAPVGYGSATVVNDGGSATVVGALADGKSFSQHVPVSADGSAPFYVYLGANEVVFGWIMNLYSSTPGGEIAWIKGDVRAQVNDNQGFTSLIAVTGSSRTVTAPDHAPIDLANAVEQSSRDVQSQIAKISENASTPTAYGSPSGF
jgi:thiamine pyrophosphokinase